VAVLAVKMEQLLQVTLVVLVVVVQVVVQVTQVAVATKLLLEQPIQVQVVAVPDTHNLSLVAQAALAL
tara:strand:+ start:82 stop:285 length:204 start_codon:yes stop_codon:yes gene_type:complete